MDRPFLRLEVDEHSAGAGVITRCEAFIDSLNNIRNRKAGRRPYRQEYTPDTKYLKDGDNGHGESLLQGGDLMERNIDTSKLPQATFKKKEYNLIGCFAVFVNRKLVLK